MNRSNKLLSDIVAFRTYAKFISHALRRETLEETLNRNMQMHLDKYGAMSKSLSKDIIKTYSYIHDLYAMPSMRGLQFAGQAVLQNNARQYNCSFVNIDNIRCFGESLFLLLSGVGVGYSVQKRHVSKLPKIQDYREECRFIIPDSIIGWAESIDRLFEAYMYGRTRPIFDYSQIRPKGSYLVTTGAKAPGPEPLKKMLELVETRLKGARGRNLRPLEVHDIICIISDCVLAGGIRRAALISLFDSEDEEMLSCKSGEWWNNHPHRARANNSAVLGRDIPEKRFKEIFAFTQESGSGEPGFSWTSNYDMGFNPCFTGDTLLKTEVGFKTFQELNQMTDEKDKLPFKLYNIKGELAEGKVWSNGIKETIKLRFSSGEEIKCTPDHRFMLNNGKEATAAHLKGKRLMPNFSINEKISNFTKLGFIQGDVGLGRLKTDIHKGLEVHIGYKDVDIADLFDIEFSFNKRVYYTTDYNATCKDLGFSFESLPNRPFPTTYTSWNLRQKSDFLKGLYSTKGYVTEVGQVSFKSPCLELIEQLQDSLRTDFKIDSCITTNKPKKIQFNNGGYLCEESYDLSIDKFQDLVTFAENIAFVHKYKNDDLSVIIKEKSPLVLSVKKGAHLEVFDFNLNDATHWGVVSQHADLCGYIAHNCHEIALNSTQFCNLTTVNVTNVSSKKDFLKRCHAVALLGTLQAGYTDFPYLRPCWKETTEREALLGCSMTGIADAGGRLPKTWLNDGAKYILELNEKYAHKIGINPAARATAIKPEGSSSCVLGSSSGVHDRHAQYYLRRIRMNKDDALYKYLQSEIPALCEEDLFSSTGGVVAIPQASPNEAVVRDQTSAKQLLERAMYFNRNWVAPGHRYGDNKHNVSLTVSVRNKEWGDVADFMYKHRNLYSGISLLPFDGGTYQQAPFEAIDEKQFKEYNKLVKDIDLRNVVEEDDNTNMTEVIACSGGKCDIV
jgi:ribonucleotide reductase alpha subunit